MIIEKVVDRFMDENTYIIGDKKTKKCAIIDPGGSIIDIFNIIKQHGLTVEYIILTHGHGDHICRVPEIKSKTNAKIVAHVNEEEVLIDRNKNLSAQLPGPLVEFDADEYVQEGDIIELGSLKLKVIHTPGHTKGGVCYYFADYGWLISGDTLFQMSIGRTDFPTGNLNDLLTAIREKLFVLPPWTKVLSGHTPPTTIEEESRCNPFLQ